MLILVKKKKIPENNNSGRNFRKFRFWSKFLEISILVDVLKKSWFWRTFLKIPFFSAFFGNYLDIGQTFLKISILVKISDNLDFSQNWREPWHWTKVLKNIDYRQNLRKISILVKKNFEHLYFCPNLRKCWFRSKFSENIDSGHSFQKSRFCSKCLDILILVNVFEKKSWFWQNFRKSWFLSAFREIISILTIFF